MNLVAAGLMTTFTIAHDGLRTAREGARRTIFHNEDILRARPRHRRVRHAPDDDPATALSPPATRSSTPGTTEPPARSPSGPREGFCHFKALSSVSTPRR